MLRRHRHTGCQHDLLRLTCLSHYSHFIVFDHPMTCGQVLWRVSSLAALHRVHPFLDHPSLVCSQLPSSMFTISPVPTSSHGEFQIFFNCSWSSLSTSCHTSVTPYFLDKRARGRFFCSHPCRFWVSAMSSCSIFGFFELVHGHCVDTETIFNYVISYVV